MSQSHDAAAGAAERPSRKTILASRKLLALLVAVTIAGAAGIAGYWQFMGHRRGIEPVAEPPFYVEMKPFVVSVASADGNSRFVQLGLNFALAGKQAGPAVSALLPEIQDAMRVTVLADKAEDIVTPAGIDKLRQAMTAATNRLLQQRLGTAEVKRLAGDRADGRVVENVLFSTLIVE